MPSARRPGFSMLELFVAFALFGIVLSGIIPLMVMQSRHVKALEARFSAQTTYYLVPSTNSWARKLGTAASVQTVDPGSAPLPPVLLIDNGDSGYSETGTGWTTETLSSAYQGNDRWTGSGSGSNTATWQFTGLQPGWYDVRITWSESNTRAIDAPFQVRDNTTLKGSFPINQQMAPVGTASNGRPWQSLGVISFQTCTISVKLSDTASGQVCADAVQVVPVRNDVSVNALTSALDTQIATAQVTVVVKVPQ